MSALEMSEVITCLVKGSLSTDHVCVLCTIFHDKEKNIKDIMKYTIIHNSNLSSLKYTKSG